MNNLLVLPILIPLATAILLIFLNKKIKLQRIISTISGVASITTAIVIVWRVYNEGILTLRMGGWSPPYGIVFVADMLGALLILATSLVGLAVLLYSFHSIGADRERYYYYPFVQFLLVGVSGSFLTGDIFNLFVFFEVMLMSSYALMSLGGTKLQLRETSKYLLVNIISSTLFVAGVAYLYAATGTLNMAHLSERIAEAGQGGVLNVIAILFMFIFSMKAGLFLFYWLPGSYSSPPLAVRALFAALLTKVGLYALIRTFTLIFVNDPNFTSMCLAWLAGATMILGSIGAIAYRDLPRIFNYNVIISVGFIAFGLAVGSLDGLNGAVFYLLHDMLAKALLFILGGMIITASGSERLSAMGGLMQRYPALGWMFFILALALTGIPPLSGFTGKVLIIRGALDQGMIALSLIALASSLFVLYSLIKVFRIAFWGEAPTQEQTQFISMKASLAVAGCLLALIIAMGVFSEQVMQFVTQAGEVLTDPTVYIQAVLKE